VGLNHEPLPFYHHGIQRRLTDVQGQVIKAAEWREGGPDMEKRAQEWLLILQAGSGRKGGSCPRSVARLLREGFHTNARGEALRVPAGQMSHDGSAEVAGGGGGGYREAPRKLRHVPS